MRVIEMLLNVIEGCSMLSQCCSDTVHGQFCWEQAKYTHIIAYYGTLNAH